MRVGGCRRSLNAVVLGCAVVLGACGPRLDVKHDYDPGADFSAVHSFSWLGIESSRVLNEFDVKRVEAALRSELGRKGLEERTKGDVYVAAYLGVHPKADTEWEHSKGLYWTEQKTKSHEGMLVVDVIDPASGKPIWRGRATAMLQKGTSPEQRSRNIARVVQKILAGFPPR